jgi:rRNA maturation RNase YbeY
MDFHIYVRKENRELPVQNEELHTIAQKVFQSTGREEKDISLVVCDDPFIQRLNKHYRKRDYPTDVLSFSLSEGGFIPNPNTNLGDIVISIDTAQRQADRLGETLAEEFGILFIHGLLHLIGYTHENFEKEKKMRELSTRILTEVKKDR